MKLFLSSTSIPYHLVSSFEELVGKSVEDISMVLIENAADPYDDVKKGFVLETRSTLQSLGMRVELLDLHQFLHDQVSLKEKLSKFDVIWFGGGNTYYLRWLMHEAGLDTMLSDLLKQGIVYGGGSAGALVAGDTLKYFDLVDDPFLSPKQIYEGLHLTNLVMIPHWGTEKIQEKLNQIQSAFKKDGIVTLTISDDQALVIDNEAYRIVPQSST